MRGAYDMNKLATASINSFGPSLRADVLPEESIFVLTSSQLEEIISRAIQPLQDRIKTLEEIDVLRADQMAYDRQRIAKLEKVEPQPLQKDRGEILRALIAANGGKMLAKDARQKMHLSRSRFSELLVTLKDEIEVKPYHLSKRQNILVLK
jgi:hypothetical protein